MRTGARPSLLARRRRGAVSLVLLAALATSGLPLAASAATVSDVVRADAAAPQAAIADPGFRETVVISGVAYPTAVRFAADGRVFVAEKNGRIWAYDSLTDTSPFEFEFLLDQVHDYWDRGLLGLALDPSLTGGTGNGSYVYVMYAYNHILGDSSDPPRWGDSCPAPPTGPGGTTDGCLISGRISRFPVSGTTISGPEQVLVEDWCQQFPSHSAGTLLFGPDGALYASGGDGASFLVVDYGQRGGTAGIADVPKNPCTDPGGSNPTPPTAEGGALRSQDIRTTSDPQSLDGSIIRINPNTGAAMSGNPFASSADANAKRIIAHGFRNPFRMTFRPGTDELWVGDVGWNTWEEINRIPDANDGVAENFGWPCYEGSARQASYDAANLDLCEDLYDEGAGAVAAPWFAYDHGERVDQDDDCKTSNGSSTTGIAFYPESGGSFPAEYRGGLFIADHSRDCIWFMPKGGDGLPDASQVRIFADPAGNPVDLVVGPDGDLFYPDFEGFAIRRIAPTKAPIADIDADTTSGPAPLTVHFDGTDSVDPDGTDLSYAWDLDGDGQFDDSTSATPQRTYTEVGEVTVRLRVTDEDDETDTATQVIDVGNTPPEPFITTPSSSLTWMVGDTISFSGGAADDQDGTLPASSLTWSLRIQHCPSSCHPHTEWTLPNVASGTFSAPDHGYPSYLELVLTAEDSHGTEATVTRRIDPKTVQLSFAATIPGVQLALNDGVATAPFSSTVIVGSTNSVSAPATAIHGGQTYVFDGWSDDGGASHDIVAPASNATYTATYVPAELTFTAYADAQIRKGKPSRNYGDSSVLRLRKGKSRVYLKFNVTGLSGAPSSAIVRLWVTNPGPSAGRIHEVPIGWKEGKLTWSNAPSITSHYLTKLGSASRGTWLEFDVTDAITGNGKIGFAISGGSSNSVDYASTETPSDPILVIEP